MAPQVAFKLNELPVTIVVKHGMLMARKNVQVVFTIGLQSILAEFPLSYSMEPLRGLKRTSKFAPKTDKPLAKKAIKNLKCNKHISDKRRAKSGAPKLALSPALELARRTLRRASQEKPSFTTCP